MQLSRDKKWAMRALPNSLRMRVAIAVRMPVVRRYTYGGSMEYIVDYASNKREVLHATKGWRKVK